MRDPAACPDRMVQRICDAVVVVNFHDLVSELGRNVVGCHVGVTVSSTGVQDADGYAPIAALRVTPWRWNRSRAGVRFSCESH